MIFLVYFVGSRDRSHPPEKFPEKFSVRIDRNRERDVGRPRALHFGNYDMILGRRGSFGSRIWDPKRDTGGGRDAVSWHETSGVVVLGASRSLIAPRVAAKRSLIKFYCAGIKLTGRPGIRRVMDSINDSSVSYGYNSRYLHTSAPITSRGALVRANEREGREKSPS